MLKELERSTKYVPDLILQQRLEKQINQAGRDGENRKAVTMAKAMKEKGYKITEIMELTGLSRGAVIRAK